VVEERRAKRFRTATGEATRALWLPRVRTATGEASWGLWLSPSSLLEYWRVQFLR
jgi:hypothetical protein